MRLIANELAERLDFHHAERINRSLLSTNLFKHEADIIYRVPFLADGRDVLVYLLLENQSKVDRFIGQRLIEYMSKLWETQRRAWKKHRTPAAEMWLSPIIPIVFYSGKEKWNHPMTLDAAMDLPEALSIFVPRHETLCLKLPDFPSEALTGSPIAQVLRVIQADDAPPEAFSPLLSSTIAGLESLSQENEDEWRRLMHYLLLLIIHKRDANEQEQLINVVLESVSRLHQEEIGQMVHSAAQACKEEGRTKGREEGLKKGIEKGREEGLEKGRELALRDTARNMLGKGMSVEMIADFTGLSSAEIAKLIPHE